jgi:hypothetical protein
LVAGDWTTVPGLDNGEALAFEVTVEMRRAAGESMFVASLRPVDFIVVFAFIVPLDEVPLFDLC